ncbi:DUF1853 family protein [Neptunomonas sp. XY-337]|uniref:DUF1853 family protein n=1 Tax=Neptunomonas sp. XY-337 TaxID=2561897 RepID=UPI0010AA2E84|nr:DUF1853 family protein [Neptunomonas sp. XY-337]
MANNPALLNLKTDLEWLYRTPSLMADTPRFSAFMPSQDVSLLPDLPYVPAEPPAYRLGKQFETTVEALFYGPQSTGRLLRNLPLTHHKRTVGELDLVYETAEETVHLELAIKFYLLNGSAQQLEHFIGPGGRDRLDKKWRRLITHQLPLGQSALGASKLTQLGFNTPTRSCFLMPGILFYPRAQWQSITALHPALNPNHQRGWWLHNDQLASQTDLNNTKFMILAKPYWLAGPAHFSSAERADRLVSWAHIIALQSQCHEPLMLAEMEEQDGEWTEKSRAMVVSNNWPDRKK